MAYNVKFLKGTAAQYATLTTKDSNTFYYIDDKNLYLGSIKISNAEDLAAAITRIAANETNIGNLTALTTTQKASLVVAINELKAEIAALTGGDTGGISEMIEKATGKLSELTTENKANLVAAINELDAAIDTNAKAATISIDSKTTTTGMLKSYTVKQGSKQIGVIDIPKDMVVKSGEVVVNPEGQTAGTYIVLTLANATEDKIYVNVGRLVDIYTVQAEASKVQLAINPSTREISANIISGSIAAADLAANAVTTNKIADKNVTKTKLADDVQTSLRKADSAVQSVTESTVNGSILVDGAEVAVHGLGSAAYANAEDFDATGSATSALNSAKAYTNAEIQKLDADVTSAAVDTGKGLQVQVVETNGKITSIAVSGNYSNTYDAKGAAATAERNAKTYTDTALTWGTLS